MKVLLLLSAVVAAVHADGIPQYGNPPPPHHGPAVHYDESPKPFAYQYGVSDSYTGTNFAANENSDGKLVTGSYTVHLPDGRVQTVTYTADHYNGYIADVKYEGVPQYPNAPKPAAYRPGPPAYRPGGPLL